MPRRKKITEPTWVTRPISCTCEADHGKGACDMPTVAAYRAMGGGWMALCYKHSLKHTEATKTDVLIARGETWK